MAFEIRFLNQPDEYLDDDGVVPSAVGRIIAGDLDEEFTSSLYEWSKRDYEVQWFLALDRFLSGNDRVVLITHYANPTESSNLRWWALYRGEAGIVHVQEHLPWYDNFDREFSVAEASDFLHDRVTTNEDGDMLSEWDVPFREVQTFFRTLKQPDTKPL